MQEIKGRVNKPLVIWLLSGCLLVFGMVVIGGITRLTGSGLSITEWNLLMGSVPPLNDVAWQLVFEKYQSSPQFQKENFHFNLNDFKNIFWWEFIHRLLGRIIGIIFIIPFIWFVLKKQISKKLFVRLIFIFALGGLQGLIGWYMVKSGLIDNPRVSHYRLAIHLITAFATFGLIFQTVLSIIFPTYSIPYQQKKRVYRFSFLIFILVSVQVIYGAFVAGLKAGHVYNTFPKMGSEWIASSVGIGYDNDGWKSFVENPASIQLVHRYLAVILVILYLILIYLAGKNKEGKMFGKQQKTAILMLGLVLFYQFLLGVFTLIYNVPVTLGVLHQMGAFFLFAAVLVLLHFFRPQSSLEIK